MKSPIYNIAIYIIYYIDPNIPEFRHAALLGRPGVTGVNGLTHSGRCIAYAVGSDYPQELGGQPLAVSSNRPILAGSDGFVRRCEKADL